MRSTVLLALLSLAPAACTSAAPPAAAPEPEHHDHHDHGHGPLVHRFEKADEWAKQFDDPARDAWQRPADVIAAMALEPGMTVADLGAGTGYFLPHLSRALGPAGKILALDVEPDMIRYMRERAAREGLTGVEPRLVPLDDPQLPPGGVDRVLIVDTWHHIDGRGEYVKKLAAGLAPGGMVLIVDFTMEAQHGPPKHHRLPPEQVMKELGEGGLSAEVVAEPLPEQYIVVGRKK